MSEIPVTSLSKNQNCESWDVLAEQAKLEQEPVHARRLLYAIMAVIVLLVFWSAFAEIDEVTRGQGKVIPSQQVQVIGSQDGGVIREILVREGARVAAGQLLVRLDQTRSQASLGENQAELSGLTVKAARLLAILDEQSFEPTAKMLAEVPDVVAQEQRLYQSSIEKLTVERQIAEQQLTQRLEEQSELQAREQQLRRERDLTAKELDVTRPMVASGAVSQVEILRLERELNKAAGELEQTLAQLKKIEAAIDEARNRIQGVRLEFTNEAREELSATLTRMNALREAGTGLSDRVRQTNVVAPVAGTVKQLFYNTVGGVVLAGREVIELVPADDTLLVEVRIRPQDIAFIAPGQLANVKVTAYDFVVYGGLEGQVEQIGADTVVDEEGNAFYEVTVRTEKADFGDDKPIIPGMTVEVDILTGKKTVLDYLMKPVLRARQRALSER
jgi:adhesin transport system membrane fusion protein